MKKCYELVVTCAFAAIGVVQAQAGEIVLHNFGSPPNGALPYAGVVRDAAGNLYGTTSAGAAGAGVVYKVNAAGQETVLYTFTGYSDGGYPYSGVTADASGDLFGTVYSGGQYNRGGVYKLNASGETVLYSFTGGADGSHPYAGVILDSAGNLYGTTSGGGSGAGVVYKVDSTGHETVLYTFTGGADGADPVGGVIRDSAGNLYGTTSGGGTAKQGVVYKVDTSGQETVLYTFTGGADGGQPAAGVIGDGAGNLYGTTNEGGAADSGVVFKLDSTGHETVLYTFSGGSDGDEPYAGVVRDSAGNLYGTTSGGGTANSGVVFKVDTAGHETVLYNFTGGSDGDEPYAGVVLDSSSNLYGTTYSGGAGLAGVVYKLAATGLQTVLYAFPEGGTDGASPVAALTSDGAGNIYGTTLAGGTAYGGTVYKLNANGETVVHSFTTAAGGYQPWSSVIADSAGNLYGTTYAGGTSGGKTAKGVLYKVDAEGNETVLHTFTGGTDGSIIVAGVIGDGAGNLYGTAPYGGGPGDGGIVYKFSPTGQYTILYSFTGGADGSQPYAGVIRDSAGNLYGTTYNGGTASKGVVYKLDTNGHETVLYTFTGGADGGQPYGNLIRDAAGNLYGTTVFGGGTANAGVVFKLDTSGHETVLYTFTGGADGSEPYPGLIADSAGNFYGVTAFGGTGGAGVVFELDTAGHETVLYTFSGGADGNQPWSGVIRDAAGNLYGTTYRGGKNNVGVIYELTP